MITRATDPRKKTFGKQLYQHGPSAARSRSTHSRAGGVVAEIAKSRMGLDQARLLVLSAANQVCRRPAVKALLTGCQIDRARAKGAMRDIGMAKVRCRLEPEHS